ncbi:MAG: 23S rRNA pseudouridine synthase F, partial [Inconstantimicrobium porci]|nr:23S rRNA pseudouridine synthase F [Inconstantimicrobium porci]
FTFKIILTQGLNRQIRKMCRALGYTVDKLKRIRILNIKIDNIEEGKWIYITEQEVDELRRLAGHKKNNF